MKNRSKSKKGLTLDHKKFISQKQSQKSAAAHPRPGSKPSHPHETSQSSSAAQFQRQSEHQTTLESRDVQPMSLKMSLNTSNQYCCMFESSHPNQLSKDSKDSVPKRNHLQPGGGPLQQNTAVTFRGKQSTVYNPFDHLESDMNSQYYVHASKESNLGFPNSRSGSAEGQLTHASGAEPTASATLSQPGQYHSLKVGKPASVHNQANFNLKNMRHRDRANVDTSMNDPTNSSMENHSNSSPKFVASTFLYNPNQ